MRPPADGWDRDERDTIEELEEEIDAVKARHRQDPPIDLLRAARHDALPKELQEIAESRLATDPWSRSLVDGLDGAEPQLDRGAEEQLLARIQSRIDKPRRPVQWSWRHLALGATAAAGVAILATVMARPDGDVQREGNPTQSSQTPVVPDSRPRFELPLEKPPVALSLAALTWRGDSGNDRLLPDLKAPLDAFREDDYARADRELARLESRYPNAIEVFFYGGVARLFVNDPTRALPALARAEDLADETLVARVRWYRAIAEQRAGRLEEARNRLDALCKAEGEYARQACEALAQLGSDPDAR